MPQDLPPSPPARSARAYALAAAAIWAMAAYDLLAPKPPQPVRTPTAATQACPH